MLPERRPPHAVWVLRFSRPGKCTSPSCRISLSRCLSSPIRRGHKGEVCVNTTTNLGNKWRTDMHTSTMTHLFVDVSVSVDVVEVEGPLELLSDGAPQQDWQRCHKVLEETKRTDLRLEICCGKQNQNSNWTGRIKRTSNLMEPLCAVSNALNR